MYIFIALFYLWTNCANCFIRFNFVIEYVSIPRNVFESRSVHVCAREQACIMVYRFSLTLLSTCSRYYLMENTLYFALAMFEI